MKKLLQKCQKTGVLVLSSKDGVQECYYGCTSARTSLTTSLTTSTLAILSSSSLTSKPCRLLTKPYGRAAQRSGSARGRRTRFFAWGLRPKDRGPKDSLKEECLPGAWQAPTALLHRVDSPRALRILQILRHRQRLQEAASREKQQREEEGELMPAAPQYKVKRQKKKAKERV